MAKKIIVPLDGSQLSHAALPLARALAERMTAAVTLVAVINPPNDMFLVPQDATQSRMTPLDIDRLSDENKRREDYLEQVATTFKGTRVEKLVRIGNPAEAILELAESNPDPVIVMASHGRTGLGRALLGSVATRVVQGANFPVFVVRASENSRAEYGSAKIERVLVPLDGSHIAEEALAAVYRLLGDSVRIHLLRIVEPIALGQAYAPEIVVEYERKAREGAEDYLREVEAQLCDQGITVTWDVQGAVPAFGITEAADRQDSDLIAMTTHGRTGIGRFLLGSVVERVLHNARRPLMIVRAVPTERESDDAYAPPLV